MAEDLRMALLDLRRKAELEHDADCLREGVRVLSQALMELEVSQHLGAEKHARTPSAQASATAPASEAGTRGWARSSSKSLRDGSCFPSLLEPRKRAERALVAVVQEASVQGV